MIRDLLRLQVANYCDKSAIARTPDTTDNGASALLIPREIVQNTFHCEPPLIDLLIYPQLDVTVTEVTALPSIYHVKGGEFR
jgi:hypothetical protein